MTPHAIILAGGNATRMGGGDKPLRPLAGVPMLDHIIARLTPQAAALAISANGDPARFAPRPHPVIADATSGQGPLAGILAGLLWARADGADWLQTAPGDTPFLPPDLAARLQAAAAPLAYATSAGRPHHTVSLIHIALAEDLQRALASGLRAIRDWMRPHQPIVIDFAGDPFFNVNTLSDLAEAERRLG